MRKRAGSRIDEFAAQVAADMTADLEAGSRSYYTGRASTTAKAVVDADMTEQNIEL